MKKRLALPAVCSLAFTGLWEVPATAQPDKPRCPSPAARSPNISNTLPEAIQKAHTVKTHQPSPKKPGSNQPENRPGLPKTGN